MDWGSLLEFSHYDVVFIFAVFVFFYFWLNRSQPPTRPSDNLPAPLPMTDMTLQELEKYDGQVDEHIIFGLNGHLYDVSRGKSFYGPGSAYGNLAGHDATRALGTMDVKAIKKEWDDHADMTDVEKETATDWEDQFKFKYLTVGRLVKTEGEKANYGGKLAFVRGNDKIESVMVKESSGSDEIDKKND